MVWIKSTFEQLPRNTWILVKLCWIYENQAIVPGVTIISINDENEINYSNPNDFKEFNDRTIKSNDEPILWSENLHDVDSVINESNVPFYTFSEMKFPNTSE